MKKLFLYGAAVDPLCVGYANCISAAVDTWEAARARFASTLAELTYYALFVIDKGIFGL